MKAPLIFCSTSHAINVQKIFKIVLSKVSQSFVFDYLIRLAMSRPEFYKRKEEQLIPHPASLTFRRPLI